MYNTDCKLLTGAFAPVEGDGDKSYICWIKLVNDKVQYHNLMGECVNPSTSKAVLDTQWAIDVGRPARPELDYRRAIFENPTTDPPTVGAPE